MVDDFDEWYGELRPTVLAALGAWCGDPEMAADAVDEAFVRAFERWERVRTLDAPAGWVWSTATNVVRRRTRRDGLERRSLRRHAAGRAHAFAGPTGDDVDLRRALLQLTERQRTAVVLRHVADLPQREVAAWMGIEPATVAATVHQARARLAALLALADEPAAPEPAPVPAEEAAP
jgi:RNA polymerase sigma-70 factor, ECF subfamily